jgi:hypothetical protein
MTRPQTPTAWADVSLDLATVLGLALGLVAAVVALT